MSIFTFLFFKFLLFPEAYGAGFPFSGLCVPQQTSHCAPAASVSLTGLARQFHGSENAAEACEWYGWRRGPWQTVSLAGLRGVLHLSAEDCQWCGCHNRLWSTASLACLPRIWHCFRIIVRVDLRSFLEVIYDIGTEFLIFHCFATKMLFLFCKSMIPVRFCTISPLHSCACIKTRFKALLKTQYLTLGPNF